jgi:hypothetical protein
VRSQRSLAWLLLLTGLALGTLQGSAPRRTAFRAGGHWVLSGDFHVHAFPGDGALAAWSLRRQAQHAGLDVFAITNHNQTLAARLGRLAGSSDGPILIVGEEITNPGFHLIAVGIEQPIEWDRPAAELIDAVHAQGGIAIAAHPGRRYWDGWDDRALARLDGVEVAHPSRQHNSDAARDFDAFYERVRQLNPDVAAIGSSDFHASPSLARCRTYVFAREHSQAGVLDAIRHGRTVAEDADGRLHGDPGLVRLVEARRPAGSSDPHPAWRLLAVTCAWVGLLGLVVLGRGER